ncbi:hypothetical protein Noda2021_00260 [Candidatus Dependentiae bacterium Noda2021]|nr:hypothetical protein Noda2021_00260 [Candidatus Dependentiae bacterium Noda2021]
MYFVMLLILMLCNTIVGSESANTNYQNLSQLTQNNALLRQSVKIGACIAVGYGIYKLGKEGILYVNEQNQVYRSAKQKAVKMIANCEQTSSFKTDVNNKSYNVFLVQEKFGQENMGPGVTAQVISKSRVKSYFFPVEDLRQELATQKEVEKQKSTHLLYNHGLSRAQASLVLPAHTVSDFYEFNRLIHSAAHKLQQRAHASKHQAIITISYAGVDYEANIINRPDDHENPNVVLMGNGICKVVLLEQLTAEKLVELLRRDLQ